LEVEMAVEKRKDGDVTFVLKGRPDARKVFLVGDFNDWDPAARRMQKRGGDFRAKVRLQPGDHQYKFVVDGSWAADPDVAVRVPDGFGAENSVAHV
jgi:1,4-alpha-glucan branching enzyme